VVEVALGLLMQMAATCPAAANAITSAMTRKARPR
jgi:hypothetical protein